MDNNEIRSTVENLVDESILELTSRTITKVCNLANELKDEDISLDEIHEEFNSIIPSNVEEDDWMEFVEALSTYIYALMNSEQEEE